MDYLIVYDISDHKKRVKISRILQKYGFRILYSAFYLPDVNEDLIKKLYEIFKDMINEESDRIFFYPVSAPEVFKGYPLEPWKVFVFE
ncbi:MAG: CRISPR-associated endonuclease Cas2 [Caldimicrobium sp.]|jgi:CRISPR-associated protein Cas2